VPDADPGQTLPAYIAAVAARTPTPGGGSVAAVAGALAAALGEMVANFTIRPDEPADTDTALSAPRDRLTALRGVFLEAAAADEQAYAAYRAAVAMPRGSETEKAARATARERALIAATEIPLSVARAAAEVARIMEQVASAGNRHLLSDAALAALLAEVALRGALLNVRGNAPMLQDQTRAKTYLRQSDLVAEAGRAAAHRAYHLATADMGSKKAPSPGSDGRGDWG
jgi:formiminotetrahydrofolate cyclodeaminase